MRAAALLTLLLIACGDGPQARVGAPRASARGERWQGSLSPRPSPDAVAVAEVNDDTIWDSDVARHAAARHLDARAALDELVELTLLAQEARRRGLADDPEVAEARKQARTRALMNVGFAADFQTPADVPASDIDLVWSNPKIYLRYNHPRYHEVRFVRLELGKDADPAQVEDLRKKAETIRAAVIAARPETREAFQEAAAAAAHQLGVTPQISDHPATERGTEPDFLAPAMALERVGDVSPVTRTRWGWDLLYLYNIIPKVQKTKEQAEPELRQQIFEESRRRAFLRWADQLVQGARVTRHDELLHADEAAGGP